MSGVIDLGGNIEILQGAGGAPFPTGTVTQVSTGSGLFGGPITTTGTISVASVSLTNQVVGNLPLTQTSGSISLTNQVVGILPGANITTLDLISGSVSLTAQTSGSLPFTRTTGSISLVNQVFGNLPLTQTSGSISLTTQVSGVLPAANSSGLNLLSGSVSLTTQVSGVLPIANGGTQWVSSASAIYSLSNIGIGTSSPAQAALVVTTTGSASYSGVNVNGTWYASGTATTSKPQLLIEPSGTTSTGWQTAGTGLGINAATGFGGFLIDAQVSGTSKFGVRQDGVVIVSGEVRNGNMTQTTSGLRYGSIAGFMQLGGVSGSGSVGTSAGAEIDLNNIGSTPSGAIQFRTGSASASNQVEVMRIDSSGNVGIGTTGPLNRLHVISATTSTAGLLVAGGASVGVASVNSGQILIGSDSSVRGVISYDWNNGAVYFDNTWNSTGANFFFRSRTGGTPVDTMSLLGSGNVGIGTTGPAVQFHTTGAVRFANFGAGSATFDASGNISSISDETLKDIQRDFSDGLDQLKLINPIVYKWNEKSGLETEHEYVGWSAQNLKEAITGAVYSKKMWTDERGKIIRAIAEKEMSNEGVAIVPDELKKVEHGPDRVILEKNLFSVSDRAVIAAMINALKGIDQRLLALENG